jgi:hypothetical protein
VKRKKLFYVPGLITLIGLPVLVFLFLPRTKPLTTLKIFLPLDRRSSYNNFYNKEEFLNSIKSNKIIEIDLRANDKTYCGNLLKRNLFLISEELKKIKILKDTSTVLRVKIGNSNTFGQIVWLFNQTRVHLINRFMFEDDAFYFKNTIPDKLEKDVEIPTLTL